MNATLYSIICLLFSLPLFSQTEVGVYFEFDSFDINAASKIEIEKLNHTSGSQSISIVGYTDQVGSTAYNETLSKQRAEAVKQYLISKGVESARIKSVSGKGKFPDSEIPPHKQRTVLISIEKEKVAEKAVKTDEILSTEQFTNLKVGETLAIPSLEFVPGSHFPLRSSFPVLNELLALLTDNPNLKIEIQGHICCKPQNTGDGLNNETGLYNLSEARAQYVQAYLVSKGIAAERLTYKGFASNRHLFPETSEANMQANRRVEIMIVSK